MILHIASYRDGPCVYHEQCIFPRYGITQYTKIRLQEYDRIYARIWYMITNIVDSDNKVSLTRAFSEVGRSYCKVQGGDVPIDRCCMLASVGFCFS